MHDTSVFCSVWRCIPKHAFAMRFICNSHISGVSFCICPCFYIEFSMFWGHHRITTSTHHRAQHAQIANCLAKYGPKYEAKYGRKYEQLKSTNKSMNKVRNKCETNRSKVRTGSLSTFRIFVQQRMHIPLFLQWIWRLLKHVCLPLVFTVV